MTARRASPADPAGEATPKRTGHRRAVLEAQLREWQEQLAEMRERGSHDREVVNVIGKVHSAQDALHAFDVATILTGEPDPERRALVQVREAIAARSHVAAGSAERQLQDLRAQRLAREAAEEADRRARLTPDDALGTLIARIESMPDHVRRQIAEAIGGTVHVVSPAAAPPAPQPPAVVEVAPPPPAPAPTSASSARPRGAPVRRG